jgi:hypothetical protein
LLRCCQAAIYTHVFWRCRRADIVATLTAISYGWYRCYRPKITVSVIATRDKLIPGVKKSMKIRDKTCF